MEILWFFVDYCEESGLEITFACLQQAEVCTVSIKLDRLPTKTKGAL